MAYNEPGNKEFSNNACHTLLREQRAICARYLEALEIIASGNRNGTAKDIAQAAIEFEWSEEDKIRIAMAQERRNQGGLR